ncbi:unnamed protein product [Gordionus sp. m RMFG-2023]
MQKDSYYKKYTLLLNEYSEVLKYNKDLIIKISNMNAVLKSLQSKKELFMQKLDQYNDPYRNISNSINLKDNFQSSIYLLNKQLMTDELSNKSSILQKGKITLSEENLTLMPSDLILKNKIVAQPNFATILNSSISSCNNNFSSPIQNIKIDNAHSKNISQIIINNNKSMNINKLNSLPPHIRQLLIIQYPKHTNKNDGSVN